MKFIIAVFIGHIAYAQAVKIQTKFLPDEFETPDFESQSLVNKETSSSTKDESIISKEKSASQENKEQVP
jgi:hypothetical protein